MQQGLSEQEFYDDLVYKLKNIVSRAIFSDLFKNITICYNRIRYNKNIMRQSACLVVNPITVNNVASLFNCTPFLSRSAPFMDDIVVSNEGVTKLLKGLNPS